MNFGTLLKKYRREHRLTQKELSDIIGISVPMISTYEKNKRYPMLNQAIDIANKTGISLDVLTENYFDSAHLALNKKEAKVITEFRKQPEMQRSICLLLGIEKINR